MPNLSNLPSSVYVFAIAAIFGISYGLHFFHIRNIGEYEYAKYLMSRLNLKGSEAIKAGRQNYILAFIIMIIGGLVAIVSLFITVASWIK